MRIRYEILLFLVACAIVYSCARFIRMIYLTRGMRAMCPKCGTVYVRPSSRTLADLPFRALRLAAYRCTICDFRFHRPRVHMEDENAVAQQ